MAASTDQILAYLRSVGVDPSIFPSVLNANDITAQRGEAVQTQDGMPAELQYTNVGLPALQSMMSQYAGNLAYMPRYMLNSGQFSTTNNNYGMLLNDDPNSPFYMRVKSGDKEAVNVPYKINEQGQYVPDWEKAGTGLWDTNAAKNQNTIAGIAGMLALGGAGLGAAGAFGGAANAVGTGATAAEGAIPGMSGGGWGLMDPALTAPGAFNSAAGAGTAAGAGSIGSTVGSGGLSDLMAGGLTGTGGATGGAAASGGGGLSSLFGGGSGGGMASFLPSSLGEWGSAIGNWLPLLGAVGGAAQGSQDQTITNQTQLPPWLQALGPQLTNASINAANQPFQPYTGQRIEPFNPNQQAAFGMVQNRAMGGSPVERAGQDAVTRAASGNANPMFGLDNPYLNKQIDNTLGDLNRNFERTVLPNIDAMNTRANTGFGTSSAVNGEGGLRSEAYRNLNETAAKTANDMRYKDYYTQAQLGEGMAGRQLQAAGLAPNLGAVDYRNADALLGIGNQQQQLGQQGQDFNYNEFMRQLQYPDQQLQRLGYPFGFNQGQTQTSTQPGVGPWAGGISGLLGGIGMSNMIGRGGTAVSGPATMTPPPRTTLPSNGYGLDGFYPYAWGGA